MLFLAASGLRLAWGLVVKFYLQPKHNQMSCQLQASTVMGWKPIQSLDFFRPSVWQLLSCLSNCDDLSNFLFSAHPIAFLQTSFGVHLSFFSMGEK